MSLSEGTTRAESRIIREKLCQPRNASTKAWTLGGIEAEHTAEAPIVVAHLAPYAVFLI
jgi:hypothetical protein